VKILTMEDIDEEEYYDVEDKINNEYLECFIDLFGRSSETSTIYKYYKKTKIIKLGPIYHFNLGLRYYEDNYFRMKINKLVNKSGGTLHIVLCEYREKLDMKNLDTVHILNLSQCKNILCAEYLKNVHTLTLRHCDNISSLKIPSNIFDLSMLKKLTVLYVDSCNNLHDLNPFKDLKELSVTNCNNVTDVSMLGKINKLNLKGCKNIADISSLTNVYNLNITNCPKIRNINSLQNTKILVVPLNNTYYLPHGLINLSIETKKDVQKIQNLPSSIVHLKINNITLKSFGRKILKKLNNKIYLLRKN
jgi:hypothetical protein